MSLMRAAVLRAPGTNCDQETAHALEVAGARVDVVSIGELLAGQKTLNPYDLMVIPGGFSYGDDIAGGRLLANELRFRLRDQLEPFVAAGKKVIGICNGFQVLVKAGLLPGTFAKKQTVTLTLNDSGKFQCHWVTLERKTSACRWLNGTQTRWDLPIAHGEGKFMTVDSQTLDVLEKRKQVVFRYLGRNPNGSVHAIAGVCNSKGNVVGLMPHPERNVHRTHHPEWMRLGTNAPSPVGLSFFKAAVEASRS